jgi:hypothetical protein
MKRLLAVLALTCHAPAALACGVCIEDRIAGAYDHAVVARALGANHKVVFFHIDGTLAPRRDTRRALEAIVESVPGVDRGSARVSLESPTLSVAFDPRSAPLATLHKALEKKLAPKRLLLMPLKVMERPAEFKTVVR